MRSDLNKQLCERERHRSWDKHHDYRHDKDFTHSRDDEFEDLPTREGMSIRYKQAWRGKEFNENLTPLKGLIHKNVGQHWDKFYSELCKNFNMNSVINKHILEHLYGYIEVNTCEIDGEIYYRAYNSSLSPIKDKYGPEYYVHPRSRQIILNKHYRTTRQRRREQNKEEAVKKQNELLVIDKYTELRFRNDVWFVCELEDVPPWKDTQVFDALGNAKTVRKICQRYDMWLRSTVYGGTYYHSKFFGDSWHSGNKKYVKRVRTASYKELKRFGLTKD